MHRHGYSAIIILAAITISIGWIGQQTAVSTNGGYRLTGPYTHSGLAIYLIHREDIDSGPVPLTLEEAMEKGSVKVIETNDIEEIVVRNLGEQEVFVQSGDIVKGGMQDRVLTVSMILPPNSGDIPIGAFCVERGRWARRGREKTTEFSVSVARMPSQGARAVIARRLRREMEPRTDNAGFLNTERYRPEGESLQSQVWDQVHKVQARLVSAMEMDVADERSPTSLQLSLENTTLASALEDYRATLGRLPQEHPGAVGYVFAINGKIYGGDEFGSASLFRKLWPRQLKAASTEAIVEDDTPVNSQPALVDIAAFIDSVTTADAIGRPLPGRMTLEIRETDKALYTEIRRLNGYWVHRNIVAYR